MVDRVGDSPSYTTEAFAFLCDWYKAQTCADLHDGEGNVIEAVDGPGWWLSVDLRGSSLEGHRTEPWVEQSGTVFQLPVQPDYGTLAVSLDFIGLNAQ